MASFERPTMTAEEQINVHESLEKLNGLFAQFASDRPRLDVLNDIIEYTYDWLHMFKNRTPQDGDLELYRSFITGGIWETQYEEEASYALLFSFANYISAAIDRAFPLAVEGGIRGVLDTAVMLEHVERNKQ